MVKSDIEQKTINTILFLGIVLSIIQYLYNRSLWLDEASLALNIINKNFHELLRPLEYNQVAPVLFLFLEKIFSLLLPDSEYGLRLLPLLSYWFSLYFIYKILKLTLNSHYTLILALSLYVFNSTLIYYSSEVKQYMSDILVSTSLYYFLLRKYKKEENRFYLLGFMGVLGIFLSNITPIILFSIGIYLLYEYLTDQRIIVRYFIIVSSIWMIAFLLYYYFIVYGHPSRNTMINYWSNNEGFLPGNPLKIDFYQFLLAKFKMLFTSLLPFGLFGKYLLPVLILIGFIYLIIRKQIGLLFLLALPIFLHLLLSAAELYPFDTRMILYICPLIIIMISIGFDYVIDLIFIDLKINRFRLFAILIPLFLFLSFYKNGFPGKKEEIKKSINYIQEHYEENDKIYIYYGASRAFLYYNDIHFINFSIPNIFGNRNRNDNEKYIDELKKLKGRNWLLFSHVYQNEETYIIGNLDSLGYEQVDIFLTYGSHTYLYDFK